MPTRHDLLIRSAARLYSLGVDVEGAREKLRELVNKKGSYESPEMREALRNFQELDAQFKALEKDHLELRPERGAQPLRNAGRSTAGDWGRKPPASKADQCAVRAGLPCLPNVKTTIIQTGVNLPIYFAEYSILRNNSHGLIIQNYSICSQILQGKMKTLLIFGIQRMEMRGKEHYLTLCKRACLYRAVNWTVKNHCAFALQI